MNLLDLLAQIPDLERYAQGGIAVSVLGWFMLVVTPRLRAIERSQDWNSTALLLLTIGLEESGAATKAKARELLSKIESKNSKKEEP